MIYTDSQGRPIPRPERPRQDATVEERIAYIRERATYEAYVADMANSAFDTGLGTTLGKTQADLDRETVEAAGYPEGIDYEELILAEDEDW